MCIHKRYTSLGVRKPEPELGLDIIIPRTISFLHHHTPLDL